MAALNPHGSTATPNQEVSKDGGNFDLTPSKFFVYTSYSTRIFIISTTSQLIIYLLFFSVQPVTKT